VTEPSIKQACLTCGKPDALCVCASLPKGLEHRTRVLILQHPQESDRLLGSARLAELSLPGALLKVGLSWPNLARALGEPKESVHPARWAVLHLGSGIKTAVPGKTLRPGLHFVSKSGAPIDPPAGHLDGFVVLDGTWSQAKALWWRNAWLLKLKRAILVPSRPSLYKELRKEPRRECLSTIETIAETLEALGEPKPTAQALRTLFAELLERQRVRLKSRAQP
jgi:DTW domain-containing protein YfiP